ncbi:unnamed protein product, partial [Ixodes pacificus]
MEGREAFHGELGSSLGMWKMGINVSVKFETFVCVVHLCPPQSRVSKMESFPVRPHFLCYSYKEAVEQEWAVFLYCFLVWHYLCKAISNLMSGLDDEALVKWGTL